MLLLQYRFQQSPKGRFTGIRPMLTVEKGFATESDVKKSTEERPKKTVGIPVYRPPKTVDDLTQSVKNAKADTVVLVFYAKRVELSLPEGQIIILGRADPSNRIQPTVDLSKFGGTGSGTSRMHAAIRHEKDEWFIEDLASSNGTWVNGEHLAPFEAHQLHGTSQLMLANLEIGLVLPEKSSQHG